MGSPVALVSDGNPATFTDPSDIRRIQHQIVIIIVKRDRMAAGVNAMLSILLIPLGDRRCLVHVFDNLPPADPGIVGAEGDLTQLRRIRNDAHFGAAEVVVEQVLKPHSGDEQEIPGVAAPLLDVFDRPITRHLSITLSGKTERLVELPHNIQ